MKIEMGGSGIRWKIRRKRQRKETNSHIGCFA